MARGEDDEYRRRWASFQTLSPERVFLFIFFLIAGFWIITQLGDWLWERATSP